MPEVTLTVGGVSWSGWTGVRVRRGLEQVAGTFSLELTERWPDDAGKRPVPDQFCTLALDGETVSTGFIDEVEAAIDAGRHVLAVAGRDATARLVDCSAEHEPGTWSDATVAEIVAQLCSPFDIQIAVEADSGEPLRQFSLQKGETAWEAIERACRMRGLLAVSDGRGGLALARSSATGAPEAELVEGQHILAARAAYSHRDRFSRYTVLGQQQGDDWLDAEDITAPKGEAVDPAVGLHRPLILLGEDQGDAAELQRRAEWEARVRAARSRRVDVTVQGWRSPAGRLWRPQGLVVVRAPSLGIDATLLIAAVELSVGGEGAKARLSLLRPGAFEPAPLAEEAEEIGW